MMLLPPNCRKNFVTQINGRNWHLKVMKLKFKSAPVLLEVWVVSILVDLQKEFHAAMLPIKRHGNKDSADAVLRHEGKWWKIRPLIKFAQLSAYLALQFMRSPVCSWHRSISGCRPPSLQLSYQRTTTSSSSLIISIWLQGRSPLPIFTSSCSGHPVIRAFWSSTATTTPIPRNCNSYVSVVFSWALEVMRSSPAHSRHMQRRLNLSQHQFS